MDIPPADHKIPSRALSDARTADPPTAVAMVPSPIPSSSLPSVPGYEILGVLGSGSMGVVYKARQHGLHRCVALKMIRADLHASQDELKRFLTEARVVASLQHPNIVQIFEINLQHDSPYFSMELVEGGTLADRLGGRPQPFRAAAQLLLTLARTIHIAHSSGIVHRDLKPANILMVPSESRVSQVQRLTQEMGLQLPELGLGTPKITDFGLAKELHSEMGQTESGIILGTPSYMAPEQAEGKSRDVGPTADIYSLGAILYEMLTGRPPFTAESHLETLLLLFQAEPVSPSRLQPRIPRDLETICLKCLQKNPRRRYASAEELADDLQRFLVGEPIQARPVSLWEETWKWARRRPVVSTSIACSILAVLSLVGLTLWHQVDLRARLEQALEDERATRQAQEATSERERLGQLRDRVKELLHLGERALTAREWQKALVQLTRARDQTGDQPELTDLRTQVERLLRQTNQQRLDRERLQKFLQHRNEALFHATLFTGGNLTSTLEETRTAALEALAQFGITLSSETGPTVESPYYTEAEKAEVVAACYELLVVLADTVAQTPLTPDPSPARGEGSKKASADGLPFHDALLPAQAMSERRSAEEALRILDRTIGLGVTTQAFHRRRADYLTRAGQKAAAGQERQRAESLRPATPLDHFLLAQEQYRRGDCPQAIRALENVLQLQPDHFWASYYLGLCWLKSQRPEQAVTCLTACLGQRQNLGRRHTITDWLYLLRASAWAELGQHARAEADFAAALKAELPDAARYGLLINRGVLRIRQDRLDSALADLRQAIALRPQQYQGYLNLAQAHLKGQQVREAIQQLDQAIRLEPTLASLYRTRARLHLLQQNRTAALADLDGAIRLEATAARPAVAEDHLERGRLLHAQQNFLESLSACDAVLRLQPGDARGHRLRAEVLLALKRLPEALQSLDHCLKFGKPDAGVFRARAALRVQLGQYPGAQTDYTRALELEPEAATYAARGWCFLVADAPRLALSDFEEAIRLAPGQGDAYAGRGYGRVLLGDYRRAVRDAEEALRRGPLSPRLCYNVVRIYAQCAVRVESDPAHSRSLSEALRADWQERAVITLTHALDSQPHSEAARFWHNVVQTDKALNPIRLSPGFRQLAARYSAPSPSVNTRPAVHREP